MYRISRPLTLAVTAIFAIASAPVSAQEVDAGKLTLDRLFSAEFRGDFFGPARWLDDGDAYTTLERSEDGQGRDLVRYETRSGERSILIRGSSLVPTGAT
ncbi:MAG: hypothetical protein P8049_00705, partial [Gemmatimonadota bacterium]